MPADEIAASTLRLTPREHEVMGLLIAGRSMKQIAAELQISLSTCSKHRTNLLRKLDVENDVQLLWWVYQHI